MLLSVLHSTCSHSNRSWLSVPLTWFCLEFSSSCVGIKEEQEGKAFTKFLSQISSQCVLTLGGETWKPSRSHPSKWQQLRRNQISVTWSFLNMNWEWFSFLCRDNFKAFYWPGTDAPRTDPPWMSPSAFSCTIEAPASSFSSQAPAT